jgi:hypothetical protein
MESEGTADSQESGLSTRGGSRKRTNHTQVVSLGIATAWLVASTLGEPEASNVSAPSLSTSSSEELYGGDAYTGIQNAGVATERAIVDGMNEMYGLLVDLDASSAETKATDMSRVTIGLAVLIFGIGVVNFNIAFQRFADTR